MVDLRLARRHPMLRISMAPGLVVPSGHETLPLPSPT
jgi:hypothetical protein